MCIRDRIMPPCIIPAPTSRAYTMLDLLEEDGQGYRNDATACNKWSTQNKRSRKPVKIDGLKLILKHYFTSLISESFSVLFSFNVTTVIDSFTINCRRQYFSPH